MTRSDSTRDLFYLPSYVNNGNCGFYGNEKLLQVTDRKSEFLL